MSISDFEKIEQRFKELEARVMNLEVAVRDLQHTNPIRGLVNTSIADIMKRIDELNDRIYKLSKDEDEEALQAKE